MKRKWTSHQDARTDSQYIGTIGDGATQTPHALYPIQLKYELTDNRDQKSSFRERRQA